MAKRKISNYKFKPGIGHLDNNYPIAYGLLKDNKAFIIAEATAYINQEIIDATKCRRDIGYIVDGVAWDVALGTNYNSIFLGLAESNSLDLSNTVFRTIERTKQAVAGLTSVAGDATALSRANAAFTEIVDIMTNGRAAADALVFPAPTDATASRIAAAARLTNNIDFLAAEVNAYVDVTYPAHNHDIAKCTRDVKYALQAATYDILYGGNSASYDSAKFFNNYSGSGSTGITAEHKAQTVAAYRRLQSIIDNIVTGVPFLKTYTNLLDADLSGSNGDAGDGALVAGFIDIVADVVELGLGALPASRLTPSIIWTAAGVQAAKNEIDSEKTNIIDAVTWSPLYTYNLSKCQRDVNYILSAYLYDLRYGGNSKTYDYASKYWQGPVAQVDGTRIPELDTHAFIRDLINDYILPEISWEAEQIIVDQVTNNQSTAEAGATAIINTLSTTVISVIENGLSSLPTFQDTGAGYIKFPGNYDASDILLITNATENEVIYSFNDVIKGGLTENILDKDQNGFPIDDLDFPKFLQTTDALTKLSLNYSTVSQLASDSIQIFVDQDDLIVRPYEFGTDAIERQRVAMPQSMLDADFEYGLQPTKWSAIGTMRGYPSVYEVPGTETDVTTVRTDSSAGTLGVGASLITVTTVGAHGFVLGDAITIKSLNQSILGSARAEGAFIIISVPNNISFSYYAKGKVGTGGTFDIQSPSTQLRKGGFYTGADIGIPSFDIQSNGSDGELQPALIVPANTDVIPYIVTLGDSPEIGSPLTAAGIPLGSQITAKLGDGGIVTTPIITQDLSIGETVVPVQSTTGVIAGLAVNRGDGESSLVNTVAAGNITFDRAFTTAIKGNLVTYTNLVGSNIVSAGFGAIFNVSRAAGVYTIAAVVNSGENYQVEDQLLISGATLGGFTPDNDLTLTIDSVDTGGEILTYTVSGTAFNGTATVVSPSATYNHNNGNGGSFNVSYLNNVFTINLADPLYPAQSGVLQGGAGNGFIGDITVTDNVYSIAITDNPGGTGYSVNDVVTVLGTQLGGLDGTNDAEIRVDSINSEGYPDTVTIVGTGADVYNTYTGVTYSTSGSGTTASINIVQTGAVYDAVFTFAGTGYAGSDTITILGSLLGGVDSVNDAVITILTVDVGGGILTFSVAGTAINSKIYSIGSLTNVVGSAASFGVSSTGTNYNVVVTDPGDNYAPNQTILINGTQLGGITPDNDLIITITDVDNAVDQLSGTIVSVSITGTAALSTSNYVVNDRIKISGSSFIGGQATTNDATLRITNVGVTGNITSFTVTGTAPNVQKTFNAVLGTASLSGNGAEFDVTKTGSTYTAFNTIPGTGYQVGETITIAGVPLEGTTPTNNCVITVTTIGVGGGVATFSVAGTARNFDSIDGVAGNNSPAGGVSFSVDLAAGSYTTSIISPGNDYYAGQTFTIDGEFLAGTTVVNDLQLTITSVDTGGEILTVSSSGTAANDVGSFTNVLGNLIVPSGGGAIFSVVRNGVGVDGDNATYTPTLTQAGNGYLPGNRLSIQGSSLGGVFGSNDLIITVSTIDGSGSIITFTSEGQGVSGTDLDLYSTVTIDAQTTLPLATTLTIEYSAVATFIINFDAAHGLVPGDTFITAINSDDGINNHNLAAGSFLATSVPTKESLTFTARAPGTINTQSGIDPINGTVYPRPDSFFTHRPYDGGVQLGTGGPQHGAQAIRQSKKYIRYQSGKGIMYTTGALFAPSYDLRSVTSDGIEVGSTITITTDDNDHGLQIGAVVRMIEIETIGYNGTYVVSDVIDERTVEVAAVSRLESTTAVLGFNAQVSTQGWHGASVRSGVFDDQNGIYWEYDGTNLIVAQRTSTKQCAGIAVARPDTNLITGTNTRFRDQLKSGDRIVIRGMTHVVSHVNSQTEITVTPDYRGVNVAEGVKICLVTDKKVKQSEWNLDRLDGTGASGYNMDPSKMQMIGIEFSWYGAGFIDFMVRGADGNFVYAHRMRNSNVNTEAFMRSGNLPVRYEIINEGQNGQLKLDIDASVVELPLYDVSFLPNAGTVYIDNEIISYVGRDLANNKLLDCTRSTQLINFQAGAQRSYSAGPAATHLAKTGVVLISNTATPLISHWGSAYITDGGFDEDRGYIFSYAEQGIDVSTVYQTAFLIRLAPSVSNAVVGDLGDRELLNRAQMLLTGLEVTTASGDGAIVIEGILNPQNYPLNPALIGWTGLSGLAQGGQPSFAQIASGAGITWDTGAAATTTDLVAQSPVAVNLNSGQYRSNNGNQFIYVSASNYRSVFGSTNISPVLGATLSGTNIRSNTVINDGFISESGNYGYFQLSQNLSGNIQSNQAAAMTVTKGGAISNANFALITQASWNASGATNGTQVSPLTSSPTFASNTVISNAVQESFGGTVYYRVTFNNSFSGELAAAGTITLQFVQPAYAQPGETVLSFIAQPGERANLDLSQLKELTNTTLGGRGTFPNGPDVLAINIYKTSGTNINGNIILRWSEAQA